MYKVIFFVCIFLSFTKLEVFKINQVPVTVFHITLLFTLILLFLSGSYKKFNKPNYLVLFMAYLIFANFINYESFRSSSLIYSLCTLLMYIFLFNFAKMFSFYNIDKLCKYIIVFYFVNILITSLFIVFNYSPTGIFEQVFQIYNFYGVKRPFGFSSEPSYAAIIIVFALMLFFKTRDYKYNKKNLLVFLMAIISVILTKSSYGIVLLVMSILYFIYKNKILSSTKFILFVVSTIVVFFSIQINVLQYDSIKRLVDLYKLVTESNGNVEVFLNKLNLIDGSINMRIAPTIVLINEFGKNDLSNWLFGYGAGKATLFYTHYFKILDGDAESTALGFFPAFVYNYGLLGVVVSFRFFLSLFPSERVFLIIVFIFILFNMDFNTQLLLYVLFMVQLFKELEKFNNESKI